MKKEQIFEDVYFSLGSNLGQREDNLRAAIEKMCVAFGCEYSRVSSFYYSKAAGFKGEDFVNCVVEFHLKDSPEEILEKCKKIEKDMGREEMVEYDASGRRIYHNRVIDIDILLYGNHSLNEPDLIIPHPMMKERDFVMVPLMEIIKD